MLCSKDIDTINNSDIYDAYKDLYLSKKEHEEKLFQGIQSANGLTTRLGVKKADDTALTVTTKKNWSKRRLIKGFDFTLDFDFFKHPLYPHGLKEDLIVRLE